MAPGQISMVSGRSVQSQAAAPAGKPVKNKRRVDEAGGSGGASPPPPFGTRVPSDMPTELLMQEYGGAGDIGSPYAQGVFFYQVHSCLSGYCMHAHSRAALNYEARMRILQRPSSAVHSMSPGETSPRGRRG